jgi:hypothetical protein
MGHIAHFAKNFAAALPIHQVHGNEVRAMGIERRTTRDCDDLPIVALAEMLHRAVANQTGCTRDQDLSFVGHCYPPRREFTARDWQRPGRGKRKAPRFDRDAFVGASRATTPDAARLDCAERHQNQDDDQGPCRWS